MSTENQAPEGAELIDLEAIAEEACLMTGNCLVVTLVDAKAAVEAALAAQPAQEAPIGYMSQKQIPLIKDSEGESGTYIPMRATPAGNFTLALYAATQSPAEGDDILEPLIYAAMMHNGTPKTVVDFERAAANVTEMLERRGTAQPVLEALPHPGSLEADEMIDELLAEYGHPANAKNAARAGYMAARRLLQHARQPLPAVDDAEPVGWGGVMATCVELCDPHFIAHQDLDELKRYAGNWNSVYRFFPIYAPDANPIDARDEAFEEAAELCELWNTTPGAWLAKEIRELKGHP